MKATQPQQTMTAPSTASQQPKIPMNLVSTVQAPLVNNRRAMLLSTVGVLAVGAPRQAQAFGSGFPGYDVNMDARKRAQERIKRERQADLDRAAAYRAKLAAEKAAATAVSASASQ